MKLVEESLCSVPQSLEDKRLEHLEAGEEEQGLCMDKGYDYDQVREVVEEFGYTAHPPKDSMVEVKRATVVVVAVVGRHAQDRRRSHG
jgi:hypothetical protein